MRRWLALMIGTVALALAGTALALAGSADNEETTTETTTAAEVAAYEALDFDSIPDGMLAEDELPPRKHVEKEPADVTPPDIVILHPEDGQVFEHREVVFEGKAEPGAKVFAGKHPADVSEDGQWRIVLELEPGENKVTIKAVDAAENVGKATVTVVYRAPEPKEEPPREEPPKEEKPHEEEPKKDEPKDEKPVEWEFSAHQLYGECGETPPYDVFWGTGKPGSAIHVESKYGGGSVEIDEKGNWEIKVIFETAPAGKVFAVHVADKFGNNKVFEFVHTN